MSSGCCSCACIRPRYKRLVDNIFPQNPQAGLVKSNMEKLTFYSLSSPEKLDRIAEYLYQRASRDISRRRIGYVVMSMEAMDQLLVACHAQTLNLFVESFLRMIQKLLESTEPDLQILATQSFVKFSNIEEDTPSYHRRYDFFISKFSSMCHSSNSNVIVRNKIRLAGIKGLQGVIRKTVSDDLVENIWEPVHMDKILPSLLYNMQDTKYFTKEPNSLESSDKNDPGVVADACFRELIGRASFGHVKFLLKPVLRHLDNHHLWVPNDFAVHTFRIIMFCIQSQYSYAVVENLMFHLDENSSSPARIRTSITHVLSKIISISAEESVGPSVLEVINSLLGHLKVATGRRHDTEELIYMESLVNCLGEFTSHLPDYQMVEIMVFILSKIPTNYLADHLLREMLLKCLLIVGTKYTNVSMTVTFPNSLLIPLLHLSSDRASAPLVQQILQTLLDRHSNSSKLQEPTLQYDLNFEPCSRADTMFLRKYEDSIYTSLIETIGERNQSVDIIRTVYTTLALVGVEMLNVHTIAGYISMIYRIQEVALKQIHMPLLQKVNLHILAISLLKLTTTLMNLQALDGYANKLIQKRKISGPVLLPPLKGPNNAVAELPTESDLFMDEAHLGDAMRESGVDVTNISRALTHRHSWVEASGVNLRTSMSDFNQIDLDSANSTPGLQRKYPDEDLSFDAMKRVLNEPLETLKAEQRKKQKEIIQHFATASFEEIINTNTIKDEDTLHNKLNTIFDRLPQVPPNDIFEPDSPFMRMMIYVYD